MSPFLIYYYRRGTSQQGNKEFTIKKKIFLVIHIHKEEMKSRLNSLQ